MENNEEYLLRVLRRTSGGLTDSLIPAHGAKLTRLVQKFEQADSAAALVKQLIVVQGFGKCALAMEWLLEREKNSFDMPTPEQFESDVLLLNEKLFEAFLNQPFDMPDFSRSFEAPARPIQDIHASDDEFIGTTYTHTPDLTAQEIVSEPESESFTLPEVEESLIAENVPAAADPFASLESALVSAPSETSPGDNSPSLRDAMTPDLFESTERVANSAVEFFDKASGERPIAMAVLRVTSRNAGDFAKSSQNVIANDFFDAFLKLIAFADEQGKIRSDKFAEVVRDVGDRLQFALAQPAGGVTLLKSVTKYLADPKELLTK